MDNVTEKEITYKKIDNNILEVITSFENKSVQLSRNRIESVIAQLEAELIGLRAKLAVLDEPKL